jgi:hypothetical protein
VPGGHKLYLQEHDLDMIKMRMKPQNESYNMITINNLHRNADISKGIYLQ